MSSCPVALYSNLRKDLADVFPQLADTFVGPLQQHECFAARALLNSILKKYEPNGVTLLAKERATNQFLDMNLRCASWAPPTDPLALEVLNTMAMIANAELPELSWGSLFRQGRHGPGASVASHECNSHLEKFFLNKLTAYSPGILKVYQYFVRQFPMFANAELARQQRFKDRRHSEVVGGSTLSIAPKDAEIGRVIFSEASINMFFQLGYAEHLNEMLANHYGYCSASQPDRNRGLAYKGSIDGTIATIDLKSSSDTVTYDLCAYVMRSDHLALMDDIRPESVKVNGVWVKLHMMSTMGNGFTFPLQTYIFSLCIKALCKVLNVKWERYDITGTHFGVFGDDIIVPTEIAEQLLSVLIALGFIPNVNKSYTTGPFRESCGADYLHGDCVRGVYIRRLSTTSEVYSAVNRLNLWSAKHLVPLRRTIRYLLPSGWRAHLIPLCDADHEGVKSPVPLGPTYTALAYRPEKVDLYVHFKRHRHQVLRYRYHNPFGVLVSTIEGHVRLGCISRRQRDIATAVEVRTTPNWVSKYDFYGSGVHKVNWETLVHYNLYGC